MKIFFFFPIRNIVLSLGNSLKNINNLFVRNMTSTMTTGWTEEQALSYPWDTYCIILKLFLSFTVCAESTLVHNCWVCYLSGSAKVFINVVTQSIVTVRFYYYTQNSQLQLSETLPKTAEEEIQLYALHWYYLYLAVKNQFFVFPFS